MTLAQALRKISEERGIAQKDIIERTGLKSGYISQIMNGKIPDPSWSKVRLIANALDVSLSEIEAMVFDD